MSIWPEIKKAINTKIGTPLNHLTWLNDYKLFGEDSYVFKNTNILHELYKDYELCMNDNDILEETFAFVLDNNNEVGKALSKIHQIESADIIKTFNTMNAVTNSSTAMNAIANSSIVMNAVANSATAMNAIANSSTAINAVTNSSTAMNAIANSSTAINAVTNSSTAMNAVANSSIAMNAVANSATAMNAIANSEIAMNAIANHEVSMIAVVNNSAFMSAVINSNIAMNAVANSEGAMYTIANSEIAMNAVANSLRAMNAIVNSSTAMNVVMNNSAFMSAVINSKTAISAVLNSEEAMNAVTTNPIAIVAIAKSTSNWSIKKPLIMKINAVSTYISNVYNILTNTTYFTSKISKYNDDTTSLNQYCTVSQAKNGFIACVLGSYSNADEYGTRLKINGDIIKESIRPNNTPIKPQSVTASNVNAIAIPTATFEDIGDGYAAITVYIAI